jgi:hypothetical protein
VWNFFENGEFFMYIKLILFWLPINPLLCTYLLDTIRKESIRYRLRQVLPYLVRGPGVSLTAFKLCLNCRWNVPNTLSRRRGGSDDVGLSCTMGVSSIFTMWPGELCSLISLVQARSPTGDSVGSSSSLVILCHTNTLTLSSTITASSTWNENSKEIRF